MAPSDGGGDHAPPRPDAGTGWNGTSSTRARRLAGAALAALALAAVAAGCGDQGDVRAPLPEPTQATTAEQMQTFDPTAPDSTVAEESNGSLELERALLVSNQRLGELQGNVVECLKSAACAKESGGILLRQLAEAAKRERAAIEEAFEHDGGDCLAPSIPKVLISLDAMIEAGDAISAQDVEVALDKSAKAGDRATRLAENCATFAGEPGRAAVAAAKAAHLVTGSIAPCTRLTGARQAACVKRYLDAAAKRAAKQLPAVKKQLAGLKGCPRQQVLGTVKIMGVYPRAAKLGPRRAHDRRRQAVLRRQRRAGRHRDPAARLPGRDGRRLGRHQGRSLSRPAAVSSTPRPSPRS